MSRSTRMVFACAVLMALGGVRAEMASTDPLVQQAKYWESRGRDDLARQAWLKVLKAQPSNAEATAALAQIDARAGQPVAPAAPPPAVTPKGGAPAVAGPATRPPAPAGPTIPQDKLSRPRQLAGAGRYDEAVAEYRKAFGGDPPDGPYALEYWQTVGGTQEGWEPARAALERLARTNPNDPNIQLAYAQHLTYREPSRRDGIDRLAAMSEHDNAQTPVQGSWRQALLWLGARSADEPRYKRYLAKYGSDTQVSAKLDGIGAGRAVAGGKQPRPNYGADAQGLALRDAYRDLDANRLASAEQKFVAIRSKYPTLPDGAGGLGLVRLKQERFGEARQLLEQATRQSPSHAGNWRPALAASRFWEQVRLGQSARDAGQYAEAEKHFRTALTTDPDIGARQPFVGVALADTLVQQQNLVDAEGVYRDVLKRNPGQPEATRGLAGILAQTNRLDEADKLVASLPPDQRRIVGTAGAQKALGLRDQARLASAHGDDARAEDLLKQALASDPVATWPRLDLARLYLREGRPDDARGLIDGLPSDGPQAPEASYIRALMAAEQSQWFDALTFLEQVPVPSRTRDMTDLQRRMWVHYQAERAAIYARQGRVQDALEILAGVEPYARTPELTGAVAFAYVDAGQQGRALYLLRQALQATPHPDPSLRLSYAGLLLKLGQDAEFDAQLAELERTPGLSANLGSTLTDLRVTQRLKQADEVRSSGNVARAYDLLEPLMRIAPEDPRIIMALARLYDQSQEPDRALALYRYALQVDPDNFDAHQGAVLAASALGRTDEADDLLKDALRSSPYDPRAYQLAATVARARGEDGRALDYLKMALDVSRQPGSDGLRLQMLDSDLRPVSLRLSTAEAPAAGLVPVARRVHLSALRRPALVRPLVLRPLNTKEDRAIVAMPRWWGEGRLTQVATSGGAPPASPPRYPLPELAPPGVRLSPVPSSGTPALKMDVPAGVSNAFGPPPMQLRMDPVLRSRDYAYEQPKAQDTPEDKILQQIAEIEASRSATLGGGMSLRTRDGTKGLDRLDDVEIPLEASITGVDAGRFTLRATPVFLDAGAISGSALPQFGTVALLGQVNGSIDQHDEGIAVGVQYEVASVSVDVGSTPLGFRVPNVVGGLSWKPHSENWVFGLDISRRAVTDSLLSYAGARDPNTGKEWGGVTATGARGDVAYDMGNAGVYANGEFHVYEGDHVRHNDELGAGGGMYFRVYDTPMNHVTVGVNLTTLFFDDNLRRFSYGNGGYFSPQHYISFGIPVDWQGGTRRLSYRFAGSIGIQNFHEDGQALYPNDTDKQAAIEALAGADPTLGIVAGFPSKSSTGSGTSFLAQVEYLMAPHLVVGATASFDNARDYDETKVLAYVRYSIAKQTTVSNPPRPVVPFYDLLKR